VTLKAALFDLDDTLIVSYANPGPAWKSVVGEFRGEIGRDLVGPVGDAVAHEMAAFLKDDDNRRLWRLKAVATRRAAVEDALRRNGFPDIAGLGGSIADRYAAFREEHMRLHPGAHEVLDAYRARGIKLGLVTNGAAEVQRMKVARFDLERRFEHIQIEEEAGFGKPDGRAYVRTLEALGVSPTDAQMTGDDIVWDVLAPMRLGMEAIWFNPYGLALPATAAVQPDRTIRHLGELLTPAAPSG